MVSIEEICWKYIDTNNEVEMVLEEHQALALFIQEEIILINTHWYKADWNKEQKKTLSMGVNCSDIFAWGCADSETIYLKDIDTLWQYYSKDPKWGPTLWCINKRKELPQKPVYKNIQADGIWNLDKLPLQTNHYNKICKEQYEKRKFKKDIGM